MASTERVTCTNAADGSAEEAVVGALQVWGRFVRVGGCVVKLYGRGMQ